MGTTGFAIAPWLGGIEWLLGRFDAAIPRHAHETYAVGVVTAGINRSFARGAWQDAGPGDLCTATADDAHQTAADGFSYVCCYPTADQLAAVRPATANNGLRLPSAIVDADLARRLLALAACREAIDGEARLLDVLARLVERHGRAPVAPPPGGDRAAVRRACDILAGDLAAPPSLTDLAAAVGRNPFALVRAFGVAIGISPYRYLVQLRIHRARDLIRRGDPLADIAAQLGFADQAHLTRQFKRQVGVTPGAYARAVGRR